MRRFSVYDSPVDDIGVRVKSDNVAGRVGHASAGGAGMLAISFIY